MKKSDIIKNAECELTRVAAWLLENAECFGYTNLKLYDAFYYMCDDFRADYPLTAANDDNIDLFYDFCQIEYDMFLEDLKVNDSIEFEKLQKYIGHTSSFKLDKKESVITDRYDNIDIADSIYNLIADEYNDTLRISYTPDQGVKISIDPEYEELELQLCKYIYAYDITFYKAVTEEYADTITAYKRLQAYKDGQVDSIKAYLDNIESDYEYQAEQEEQQRIEYEKSENDRKAYLSHFNDTTAGIYDKYRISVEDMSTLYQLATV